MWDEKRGNFKEKSLAKKGELFLRKNFFSKFFWKKIFLVFMKERGSIIRGGELLSNCGHTIRYKNIKQKKMLLQQQETYFVLFLIVIPNAGFVFQLHFEIVGEPFPFLWSENKIIRSYIWLFLVLSPRVYVFGLAFSFWKSTEVDWDGKENYKPLSA